MCLTYWAIPLSSWDHSCTSYTIHVNAGIGPTPKEYAERMAAEHRWIHIKDEMLEVPELTADTEKYTKDALAGLDAEESKARAELVATLNEINEKRQTLLAITDER